MNATARWSLHHIQRLKKMTKLERVRNNLKKTQMKLGRQFTHDQETLSDAKMQLNSTLRGETAPVEEELDPAEQFERIAEEIKLNAAMCTTEQEAREQL